MRNWSRIPLLIALLLVAGCGGSDEPGASGGGQDARAALQQLRPIGTAQVNAEARMSFDNAPAEVGNPLVLRFDGPIRSNGVDKFPSLDWKVSFSGFNQSLTTRLVSTGSDIFVRLGGVDFAVGEDTVARLVDQANQAQAGGRTGLGAIGVDPVAAIADVREAGTGSVAGVKVTRYTGTADRDKLLDQFERLFQGLPSAPGVPTELTDVQRAKFKSMFAAPRFEVDVAGDRTIRRMVFTVRFKTPLENREASGGISGGSISYAVSYAPLTSSPKFAAPRHAEPIADFMTALEQQLKG
jgi:hypothetical protein